MTAFSLDAVTGWSHHDWKEYVADLAVDGRMVVGGARLDTADGGDIQSVNPASGEVVAAVARGTSRDVDTAVGHAVRAYRSGVWARMAPRDRAAVLFRWAGLVEANAAELCALDTLEMGRPVTDMLEYDIPEVVTTLRFFAESVDKATGTTTATDPEVLHYTLHQPLGVVGAISPWNYPLMMATWKFAPALAAGNSVVLKPAEEASLSSLRVADLFTEAGGPPGVFNVTTGVGEEAGAALGLHGEVDKLTFTGSVSVGKELLRSAGESNMKKVALECGGKSPQLMFADLSDLDAAVDAAIDGIFTNMGEVCNAGSRVLVHETIYDEFLARFAERARGRYVPGDPLDPEVRCGPLVDHQARDRVEAHTAAAEAEGARKLFEEPPSPELEAGAYVAPAAYADVTNEMALVREEVFGPVVAIMPFATEDEAISLANDSDYGLAAGVWTSDLSTAHRCVRDLEAGTIWVNTFDDGDMTQPFGGWKQSGNSRDKCFESMLEYTQSKSAWLQL
jgi:gamma-glutamyl-gamma-aminobutyraldehyde dehydrogenase